MLKYKIDTDTYNTLDDNAKSYYAQTTDGYQLQVDGVADPAEVERLRAHNERVLAEKKAQQEQAKQAEADKLKAEQDAAVKAGDFEKFKIAKDAELEAERTKNMQLTQENEKRLIDGELSKLADQLTTNTDNKENLKDLMRGKVNVSDGTLSYTGLDGQALTSLEELSKQVAASSRYASLIDGTKASGTGGTGSSNPINKSAGEYTEAERAEIAKTNPELFKQLFLTR